MKIIRVFQIIAVGVALVCVPGALTVIVLFKADPVISSNIASIILIISLVTLLLSPCFYSNEGNRTIKEKLITICSIWLLVSGIAHVTWELSWCFVHPYLHNVTAEDTWAWIWWAYGVADRRYLVSEPSTVILEWVTATVGGPLTLYAAYLQRKSTMQKASIFILIASLMDLYGAFLYFGTEILDGFYYIDTEQFVNFWIKFLGLNSLWVFFSILCIYIAINTLLQRPAIESEKNWGRWSR
ncbi:EXPERA domain-containing protein [Planktothrix agardhii]|jgi:hypothetical protein|uniref:EXPERA domain-containing protein n=1 Tax=Planktothrix agardhii TaxID=1160 RepID=UPI001D0B8D62|nr:emopamil-binding family protein [Planktothrix agardhii]MCB8788865.1 emopamil-binding family protein [Planktothrix agardhii 1025]MCF3614108.1 emopamil-binding family protein [Planktothrix agardhii 1027]MCF3647781.1 emopamil-binding family protein [Planktothrix agardhii 1026]CAD5983278.1 putative 3-beta-hydroxysteroid-Delta(8),Delta(7)-isomerase [Planktothrix agardhii]